MSFTSRKAEKEYYEHQATQEEFLTWYKQQEKPKYVTPSLTVDMVLMCYSRQDDQLKVLLIKRKGHPYKDSWALPGGFVQSDESTGQSVLRETKEETGVDISMQNIEQLHTFSTPDRDPRGWVVTVSYLAFIGEEPLTAGDDAQDVRWFSLKRQDSKLELSNEDILITLDLTTGESSGPDQLAFDHSEIILRAFKRILNKMDHEPQVLQVLGNDFTITEARKVFAKFLGVDYRSIDHSNLKKSLLHFLHETGEKPVGIGRPSKTYRLDSDSFGENRF